MDVLIAYSRRMIDNDSCLGIMSLTRFIRWLGRDDKTWCLQHRRRQFTPKSQKCPERRFRRVLAVPRQLTTEVGFLDPASQLFTDIWRDFVFETELSLAVSL